MSSNTFTNENPVVVTLPPQTLAVIPIKCSCEDLQKVMGPAMAEVKSVVAKQNLVSTGALLMHHVREPSCVTGVDIRICLPLETGVEVRPEGRVEPGVIPTARVARMMYTGDYSGIPDAWGRLDAWTKSQCLKHAGWLWEQYIKGPESGCKPEEYQTVLYRVLEEDNPSLRTIDAAIEVDAPTIQVWKVLTSEDGIKQWGAAFGPGVHAVLPHGFKVGGPIEWKMLLDNGESMSCVKGSIGVYEEGKTYRTDFPKENNPSQENDFFESYTVSPLPNNRSLVQCRCGPLPNSSFDMVLPGWPAAMIAIKALAEGKPLPKEAATPEAPFVMDEDYMRPIRLAGIKLNCTINTIKDVIPTACQQIMKTLDTQGIQIAGSMICYYCKPPCKEDNNVEMIVGYPIGDSKELTTTTTDGVTLSTIPKVPVARVFYTGPYSGLGGAWGRLFQWMTKQGHKKQEPCIMWESYIKTYGSGVHENQFMTQLNIAINKDSIPNKSC